MIVYMTFLLQADGVTGDSRNAVTINENKGIASEFAGCCIELALYPRNTFHNFSRFYAPFESVQQVLIIQVNSGTRY
jgi:hypothetical protein